MDIFLPDDGQPTGRLVAKCPGPAGHPGRSGHNPGFPTSHPRTSGVIESGCSC